MIGGLGAAPDVIDLGVNHVMIVCCSELWTTFDIIAEHRTNVSPQSTRMPPDDVILDCQYSVH